MLAPGTAPRETVEGGRVDRARPPRGGPSTGARSAPGARDGACARREHRRGQEVLV